MNITRLVGIVAVVVGIILLGFGINSSQAFTEQVMENVVGRYTEHTMWYIVGGAALIAAGIYAFVSGKRPN